MTRHSEEAAGHVRIVLGVACVLMLCLLIGVGAVVWSLPKQVIDEPFEPQPNSAGRNTLDKPDEAELGYVGSAACVTCHQDIADKYKSHPMANCLAKVAEAKDVEDFEHAEFFPTESIGYRVDRADGKVIHHEVLIDKNGETVYDQAEEIAYALGSGQRGRSYLLNREGRLFQSPIGWYSHEKKWDLSPGYKPGRNERFSRSIGDGCLYCHSGRVSVRKRGSSKYNDPPFLEEAISCERCHGPGRDHVQHHSAPSTAGLKADPIVNPAKLSFRERESVCYQCHLQGESIIPQYGRGFHDFRPGQKLEDSLIIFVAGERLDEQGNTRAVSHVEQMRASKCFKANPESMGCISCHDPHFKPAESERTEFFQQRCLQCHEEQGCSLPEEKQLAAPAAGSCIHCHMPRLKAYDVPHTSQTDHRIVRDASKVQPLTLDAQTIDACEVFDGAESRLSKRVVNRAKGLAISSWPGAARNPELFFLAEKLLLPIDSAENEKLTVIDSTPDGTPIFELIGDDLRVLQALGLTYTMQRRSELATACWQRVLQYDEMDEMALEAMMQHHHGKNQIERAAPYLQKLVEMNPYESSFLGRTAHILGQNGDFANAIPVAERAVELDPANLQLREWLVEVYHQTRQFEKRDEQRKKVTQLKELGFGM